MLTGGATPPAAEAMMPCSSSSPCPASASAGSRKSPTGRWTACGSSTPSRRSAPRESAHSLSWRSTMRNDSPERGARSAEALMTTPRPQSAQTRERAAMGVGGASPQWPQKLTSGAGAAGGSGTRRSSGRELKRDPPQPLGGQPTSGWCRRRREIVELHRIIGVVLTDAAFRQVQQLPGRERRRGGEVPRAGVAGPLATTAAAEQQEGQRAGGRAHAVRPAGHVVIDLLAAGDDHD